jgi:hypothetical protein
MVSYFLQKVISAQVKLSVAIILNTCVAAMITIVPHVVHEESICYRIMLALMFFQGCNVAFMQSALYGIGGVSHKFTNNLMVGVAVGGVSTNLVRIIMKACVKNQDISYIVFFSVCTAYLCFCSILALIFIKDYNACLRLMEQTEDDHNNLLLNRTEVSTEGPENLRPVPPPPPRKAPKSPLMSPGRTSTRPMSIRKDSAMVYQVIYPAALTVTMNYAI